MKQKLNRNILKASLAITFATFLMGNTQCEQPVDNKRQLKKNVRIVEVSASSFLNNGGFNFSEVAQSQLSGVLFENNNFYERTVYPDLNQIDGANNGGLKDQKYFGVQKTSVDSKVITQLKTWFPTMKAKEILLDRESSCFIQRPPPE